MQIRRAKTLLPYQDGAAKTCGICWSANGQKLAVATAERVIFLFDANGEKRDKFSTKPSDSKFGKKSYSIKGIAFSPDSTKIAIGQTDQIVFVYKIGDDWGDKKVICNKFSQASSVTCLIWPGQGPIVLGLSDGKVRAAHIKTNKSQTLYATESFVETLASNQSGTGFISGHADGTIVRFYVAEDGTALPQGKVVVHGVAPTALVWAGTLILASGSDQRLVCYSAEGRSLQQFDYSRVQNEHEVTVAVSSGCGQMVALGSFDKIRILSFNSRKRQWEENAVKEITNMYTVNCFAWRSDSLYLVSSSLCGGVELLETVAKRTLWNGRVEIIYISSSQVVIKCVPKEGDAFFRPVVIRTQPGLEIETVRIMGRENYAVARTNKTLILADLKRGLVSEVPWKESEVHQEDKNKTKFHFDTPHACMVFSRGELSLIEYGVNAILERLRMEFMNPHLISVRINERHGKQGDNVKRLAYLLDLKTIGISDLFTGHSLGQISHESKIDWLEMNETGRKLLFRDQKLRLYMVDLASSSKTLLLSSCLFVEWVAGSDVIVAQSPSLLHIWYHAESSDKVQTIDIRGEVLDIVKEPGGRTTVRIQDGTMINEIALDDQLIEFGTAIEDGDFIRALSYLERLDSHSPSSTKGLWLTLAHISLDANELRIASRCYAALGDIAKVRFLMETVRLSEEVAKTIKGDGLSSPLVQARMAIFQRDLSTAERIYIDQGNPDDAVRMYRQFLQWEDALRVAETYNLSDKHQIRQDYLQWLQTTCQESTAAEVYERAGDHASAVTMCLKAGLPSKAAKLMLHRDELLADTEAVHQVVTALQRCNMYVQAGEMYQATAKLDKAFELYRKGHAYAKAIDLARQTFPGEVTLLEELWGDYLVSTHLPEQAIAHYIEAGKMMTALRAAIEAHQWEKAADILDVVGESNVEPENFQMLARYYVTVRAYEKAEKFFIKGQLPMEVVKMYISVGHWSRAYEAAKHSLPDAEMKRFFTDQGQVLAKAGRFREAEQLFIAAQLIDSAVEMYRSTKNYDQLIRIITNHQPDQLLRYHLDVARQLQVDGNRKSAEKHFIAASAWRDAVTMYRDCGLWEDAFRVVRAKGSPKETAALALEWSLSVGPEVGGKLLLRQGMAEECIALACNQEMFEFAVGMAQSVAPHKLKTVQRQLAVHLQTAERWKEAEEAYVKAGVVCEAIEMHLSRGDWLAAEQLAEQHDPEGLNQIFISRAQASLEAGDLQQFETFILRAQQPLLLLQGYKERGHWQDVLRVAKEYLPNRLAALQDEYDHYVSKTQGVNAASLIAQARDWELQGEYSRAVVCYFKITLAMMNEPTKLVALWNKASELAVKFLDEDKAVVLVRNAARQLREIGQSAAAAQLYLSVDSVRDAVDVLMEARDWTKARKIAQELEPDYYPRVESAYRDWLRAEGKADQLADVDLGGALEMLASQGQWDQVLQKAQKHGSELLYKYVAIYSTDLIKQQRSSAALELFIKYGAPAKPQNLNIYRHLASEILLEDTNDTKSLIGLRNIFHQLVKEVTSPTINMEFERFLRLFHYTVISNACQNVGGLEFIAAKASVSLLRYADLFPADKAFYEAGTKAKAVGWDNLAFVLLNRYLDIADMIEDNGDSADSTLLDNTDFERTDIPFDNLCISAKPCVNGALKEQAKEWVLAVSLDQRIEQQLPLDERGVYEACLINWKMSSDPPAAPCVLTGYPVLRHPVKFPAQGKETNREDWNRFLVAVKRWPDNHQLHETLDFIEKWCNGLPSVTSQFAF